jgi:hypothetical protein
MLKQYQAKEELSQEEQAKANHARVSVSQISPERVSPKAEGIRERARQNTQSKNSKPMRTVESSLGKVGLWRELIADNPMYQKEMLSGKRALELRTPTQRFLRRAVPLLLLGGIYLSVYVFIITIYNNAYQDFVHRFDPDGFYVRTGWTPDEAARTDYLLRDHGTADNYATRFSQSVSQTGHGLLLALQFLVVAIGIPATAITKITAERERMNWDALLLSRMTPLQILLGKLAPVLQTIGKATLALLPALIITGYMGRAYDERLGYVGFSLWGVVMAQVCLLMTALMNVAIALYFSLKEKQGTKAALITGRWFAIPTLGMGALTGLLYTIVYMVQVAQGVQYPNTPGDLQPFLWMCNLINPIFAVFYSIWPEYNFRLGHAPPDFTWYCYYYTWLILPYLYPLGAAAVILRLWRKMVRTFDDAPKDASG